MKQTLFSLLLAVGVTSAHAQSCPHGAPVRVTGDVPAAISYDVFSHLYPLKADVLARMTAAQQVTMIPNGTVVCTITDDGVPNPGAVLVAGPQGRMNYWLSSASVQPVR
ncbi:hypothetical protein [Paraburkholderia acidisoli]|uniref:Uncharacterized protein n=1 Tax=Paraburkholderia acidisoli TaxID=2571748 RepID=A0A7Z2GPL9_9BURK|nr:hypothetical protein [Paraburkholderia acidisoli]QGZ65641.1 hypothetical protein FAZ98_28285 [Paraburkholderia acidisoli]